MKLYRKLTAILNALAHITHITGAQIIVCSRKFALANRDTSKIKPVAELIQSYLARPGTVSIDPFARDCPWATYTNDLNPRTSAQSHLNALEFLLGLRDREVKADVIIFDPPFGPGQAKECYEEMGFKLPQRIAQTAGAWAAEKNVCLELLKPGGVFICLGWNSSGLGKGRGYKIVELLLVNHGRGKQDTICTVERIDRGPTDLIRVPIDYIFERIILLARHAVAVMARCIMRAQASLREIVFTFLSYF